MRTIEAAVRRPRLARARKRLAANITRPWPFHETEASAGGPLALTAIGDLVMLRASGPLAIDARPAMRKSDDRAPCVLLLCVIGGTAVFRTPEGRLKPLRTTEVLVACSESALFVHGDPGVRAVGLIVPVHLIVPRFIARERMLGGASKAHGVGVGQLLSQLIIGLDSGERPVPGPGALADAVGGLLSATLEDCWSADGDVEVARLGRARMQTVDAYLRRHFADSSLTPSDVAQAIGVSRRYLHKLFALSGRSFRQDLVALRLDACLKAFADAEQGTKTIAEIAFAAGYTDISQFNRHFRRVKGATPTAVRAALRSRGGAVVRMRRLGDRQLAGAGSQG